MLFAFICVLATLAIASGAVEKDRVTKLPGFVGDLPSTHYSGCKKLHRCDILTAPFSSLIVARLLSIASFPVI